MTESNSPVFLSKPGKVAVLAFVSSVWDFGLGICLLGVFFVLHYYILEAAILGKFSHMFFHPHVPRQQRRWCHRAWAQGSPSSPSHGARSLLTLACHVSPFSSARDGRQDTAASLRSMRTEKENNWIDFQRLIIYKYFITTRAL